MERQRKRALPVVLNLVGDPITLRFMAAACVAPMIASEPSAMAVPAAAAVGQALVPLVLGMEYYIRASGTLDPDGCVGRVIGGPRV